MYNINILVIFCFPFSINFDIFLVVGTLGGVPPPKPPCFFPGAAAPGPPRPSHSIYERFSNSTTVLFERVHALKLVSIDQARKIKSNALVKVPNGLLEPELWHIPHV